MTANQRRPGFRLPWSSEEEGGEPPDASVRDEAQEAAPGAPQAPGAPSAPADGPAAAASEPNAPEAQSEARSEAVVPEGAAAPEAAPQPSAARQPTAQAGAAAAPTPASAAATEPEPSSGFLRDLIVAMRGVAEEARQTGVTELRARTEEQVTQLNGESARQAEELRSRAEADIGGVGEWARAEAERIRKEAEQRVAARRTQLEQQLAAETTRAETEAKALRARVSDYERELDAYHAQLAEINDPAAFAAAAKRMPRAPGAPPPPPPVPAPAEGNGTAAPGSPEALAAAGEEVLAVRLAELDARLGDAPATAASAVATDEATGPVTTEIVVKGLGSFGAITGFRQALAGSEGIEGVTLSLGPTGEFVFRAAHAAGVDLGAAITELEGDSATVESRPEGGLRVTLERAR